MSAGGDDAAPVDTSDLPGLLDGRPVTFERRSIFLACLACGALLYDTDRERHARAHAALRREIKARGPRW